MKEKPPRRSPETSRGSTMLARLITASADLQPPPEELEEAAGKQDKCAALLPAAPANRQYFCFCFCCLFFIYKKDNF